MSLAEGSPPAYTDEPVTEADLLALFCELPPPASSDGGTPSFAPSELPSSVADSNADDLAAAFASASLVTGDVEHSVRGGGTRLTLPTGESVSARSAFRSLLGDQHGGSGATSSSRTARVRLAEIRPADRFGVSAEPDLSSAIFPGSVVLAPYASARGVSIDGVVGPGMFVGVAVVEDFFLPTEGGKLVRPEYLLQEQVPKATFRLAFLQQARDPSACHIPRPDDADDEMMEDEPPLSAAGCGDDGSTSAALSPGKASAGEEAGFFASPYAKTAAVMYDGDVLLANASRCHVGSFALISISAAEIAAAQEFFPIAFAKCSQRELLSFATRFDVTTLVAGAASSWAIQAPTEVMRLAAVEVRCNWPVCSEQRFPQAQNGVGRRFGMFKHLNVHAAEAGAAALELEPVALRHAANACGLCGSSAAGCVVKSGAARGADKPLVLCNTAPMCHKTPSLKPPKPGKLKNVPVKCVQCNAWVWSFALRSHCALLHSDKELPPAMSKEAIETLKAADRVKSIRTTTADGTLKRQRAAHGARAAAAAAAASKRPRAGEGVGSGGGVDGGGGGGGDGDGDGDGGDGDGNDDGDGDDDSGGDAAAAGAGGGGSSSAAAAAGASGKPDSSDDDGDGDGDSDDDKDGGDAVAAMEAAADVIMPLLPKFSVGDTVSNMGYPAVIKEVVLGNEATGGATMYVVRFTDHKGGVVEAELFEHQLSAGAKGARTRTSWKDRVRQVG